jgi:molybdopterin converting factor small subunit
MAMDLDVEFLGLARELVGTRSCTIRLESGATFRDLLLSLASTYPALLGKIIDRDSGELTRAFMLNVDGRRAVTDLDVPAADGQRVLLMFAEAGG